MGNYNDCTEITTYCGAGLCGCLIGSSIATYLISGVVFLVKDYNIWTDCDESNLWPFVLVSLIFTINKLNLLNYIQMCENIDNKNNNNTIGLLISIVLVEIGLCIWGGFELFDKCEGCELEHTNLWYHGVVTFSIQLFITIIWVLILSVLFEDKLKNNKIQKISRNALYNTTNNGANFLNVDNVATNTDNIMNKISRESEVSSV